MAYECIPKLQRAQSTQLDGHFFECPALLSQQSSDRVCGALEAADRWLMGMGTVGRPAGLASPGRVF
jgi:hypothetical protein